MTTVQGSDRRLSNEKEDKANLGELTKRRQALREEGRQIGRSQEGMSLNLRHKERATR